MARKKAGNRVKKDFKKQTSVLNSDEEEFREIDKRFHAEEDDEVDDFYKKKDKVLLSRRDEASDSEPEQVYGMSSNDDEDDSEEENELLNEDYANDMVARFVKKKEIDSDIEEQEEDIPDGKAWGRKRQDFYDNDYNVKDTVGAVMSEQDRQVAKMEEEEALAIQKRLASEVDEDVFGLDDLQGAPEEDSKKIGVLDISKLPRKKLLRMVEEESPELQGLVDDCRDKLHELDQELTPLVDLFKSGKLPRDTSAENYVMLRHNLLLSYTTNVCFYLSLKAKRVNIKSHPIIKRLGQFKKLITELDATREKVVPLIRLVLEKASKGESFKVFKEKNSEEDDELESSEDGDEDDEIDEQLSDEDIAEEYSPIEKRAKRTLDTAEQEISALYDEIKSSKKFKKDENSEEEIVAEDDPAAIFGDTDSENDEPVFLEGKAGEEDEDDDDSESEESPLDPSQDARKENPVEEEYDDDGRRAINYQIAKNKGLTPKRKKEYRNPRVRHRIKYRKANIRRKGQVRAMRNESGHYGGEMSGINKQVVKSVKLK